jgi:hypothetical protein
VSSKAPHSASHFLDIMSTRTEDVMKPEPNLDVEKS